MGGYGGYSLASWHGLGGGGHRLMTGGCNRSCGAGGCAPGCHNFNVGWLGSLMERLRNCCGTRAMSHGSLDRCGLTSSSWASYPAGNLDVSFGKGNGCYGGTSNGQHDGGEGAQQPSNELQPAPVPEDLPTAYQRHQSSPHNVNRLHGSRIEDSVPLPPVTGTDAKLKLNQVSLNR